MLHHPDGRILVAGRRFVDGQHDASDWMVLRLQAGGSLDLSFGEGGMIVTDFGSGAERAEAMAAQADGRIVVAGLLYGSLGLARYLAV